jgi:hypothetical protein
MILICANRWVANLKVFTNNSNQQQFAALGNATRLFFGTHISAEETRGRTMWLHNYLIENIRNIYDKRENVVNFFLLQITQIITKTIHAESRYNNIISYGRILVVQKSVVFYIIRRG